MKDELQEIIYEWVKRYFGQSEADDPSWNIEALAEELNKHLPGLFHYCNFLSLREDIKRVAEQNLDLDLTDKELDIIADDYQYSEAYCSPDTESIEYFIKKYKGEL